jgi:hypothetical protein
MPTLRRRNSDPSDGGKAPLRSSLADAAWAVEDRVVWGAADVFRALFDALKWPFERIAWALEHWLIWPIQEETALWSRPVRAAVLAAVILLAGAGVAAGVVVSDPSGGDEGEPSAVVRVSSPGEAAAPVPGTPSTPSAKAEAATGGPVLQSSNPDFSTEQGGGITKAQAATEPPASHIAAGATEAAGVAAKPAGAPAKPDAPKAAGPGADVPPPAAIEVARKFSGAFVLYETGSDTARVKSVFRATATPDLAKQLLERPPRLPADVKVPKAKVLNIVPGPTQGGSYTLSVSLLRVGVTSELRLEMEKTPSKKKPRWLVTDVRG